MTDYRSIHDLGKREFQKQCLYLVDPPCRKDTDALSLYCEAHRSMICYKCGSQAIGMCHSTDKDHPCDKPICVSCPPCSENHASPRVSLVVDVEAVLVAHNSRLSAIALIDAIAPYAKLMPTSYALALAAMSSALKVGMTTDALAAASQMIAAHKSAAKSGKLQEFFKKLRVLQKAANAIDNVRIFGDSDSINHALEALNSAVDPETSRQTKGQPETKESAKAQDPDDLGDSDLPSWLKGPWNL